VFLDEIGEMPLLLQAKLLRVLETRLVTRVGGLKPKAIDVRFVAATNRNLEEEVAAGRFRRDLYFRLNGMTLHIPPLRARRGEIAPLAALFLRQFSEPLGRDEPDLSDEARLMLESYVWPGNVRELRNMMERAVLLMERAVLLCTGDEILPEHLLIESMSAAMAPNIGPAPELAASYPPARAETGSGLGSAPPVGFGIGPSAGGAPSGAALSGEDEREHILRVLAECGGNQSRAAKVLGIARSTLVLRLNEYQVPRPRK
jgi:transcriptional regulator with PAS, ATPase and Fis domain